MPAGDGIDAAKQPLVRAAELQDPVFARRGEEAAAGGGYGPGNPLKFTALISPGGSGQMQPLPMNEFIQQNLKAIGIDDIQGRRVADAAHDPQQRALDPSNVEIHAVNNSWETSNPATGMEALFASWKLSPKGVNWGVQDPELDALIQKILVTFDRYEQDELMRKAHEMVVDKAYWVYVVYDINVHALSPRVKGFKPAISWNFDYTQISVQ